MTGSDIKIYCLLLEMFCVTVLLCVWNRESTKVSRLAIYSVPICLLTNDSDINSILVAVYHYSIYNHKRLLHYNFTLETLTLICLLHFPRESC